MSAVLYTGIACMCNKVCVGPPVSVYVEGYMLPLCWGVYHCVYMWSIMCLCIHAKQSAHVLSCDFLSMPLDLFVHRYVESVYLLKGG